MNPSQIGTPDVRVSRVKAPPPPMAPEITPGMSAPGPGTGPGVGPGVGPGIVPGPGPGPGPGVGVGPVPLPGTYNAPMTSATSTTNFPAANFPASNVPAGFNKPGLVVTPVPRPQLTRGFSADNDTKIVNVTQSPSIGASFGGTSFGSFLTNINKSVSSALNNLMSFQQPGQQGQPGAQPGTDFIHGVRPMQPTPLRQSAPRSGSDSNVVAGTGPVMRVTSATPQTHLPPSSPNPSRALISPSYTQGRAPRSRSPSPNRDIGFSSAVTNLVDQAHAIQERDHPASYRRKGALITPLILILKPHIVYYSKTSFLIHV